MILDGEEAVEVANFDGAYLVTASGNVYTTRFGDPRPMSTYGDPARVKLSRNGNRYDPLVETLVRETFGDEDPVYRDDRLRWYLRVQYQLTDDEVDAILAE